MTTYSMKAPNGQTYKIDGPEGATDDQVRAEIVRQHGSAVETAAPKQESYGAAAGRALYNLPRSGVDMLHGLETQFGPDGIIAQTVMHPVKAYDAATGFAHKAADVLAGGVQRVRDMSPADAQGVAPRMDTAAYDKFAGDNYDKYGSGHKIVSRVADDPAGAALALSPVLGRAAEALGVSDAVGGAMSAVGGKVGQVADKVGAPLKRITEAERRATAMSETMRGEASGAFKGDQAAAQAEAAAATTNSSRAAALAEKLRARRAALSDRSAEVAKLAEPPALDIGEPRHLSDIGDDLRTPALAQQDAIGADMRAAYDKHRTAMEQVAADREAAGVGVSDSNTAKIVIRRSKALVEPDPVKRPGVGAVLADSAGGKLHRELLDVLEPKEVPLSVDEAKRATKAGIKVNVAKDGSFTRTIKPDLKTVEDFQRKVGKILDGKIEGYEAINRVEAGQMYDNLTKVMDKYVGGARAPVQAAWKEGKRALQPYERVGTGKAIVGTQKGTEVASVPAANLPGRMIAGGRDTVNQMAAVSGEAPVAASLRSQVQNALARAKTADDADALVRHGTELGDAINTDPDLSVSVANYVAKMRNAEAAGADAKSLADRAATAGKRATKFDKRSGEYADKSTAATETARARAREFASLEIAEPKDVGRQYKAMLDRAHGEGSISTEKYQSGLKLAARAEKDFALKASRDKWLRWAGYAAGLGIAPTLGTDVVRAMEH